MSPVVPTRVRQFAAFVLHPSKHEEDPAFRKTLTQVVHAGLRWGGSAALLGLVLYVAVEILVLGRPVRWVHQSGRPGEEVVLIHDLLLVVLCLGSIVLPSTQCSLNRCRAWAAGGLLLGAGVFLRSDLLQGGVEVEFVALLFLLVVVAVPYRPWQVVGMGLGLEAELVLLGVLGVFVPEPAAVSVDVSGFGLSLGFATLLATLVSAVLYATRLAQHRERKEAQAALRRSHDLLRRTQSVAGVGGWEYDAETDTLRGTEQTLSLFDLSGDDDFGLEVLLAAFAPDARERLRQSVRRCLTEGDGFDVELCQESPIGRERWIRIRGEVRPGDEQPDAFPIAGTVQDVTEQRRMERRLREREEWLRSITENVPDGICRSHPDEGLVYANQAFARMFGYEGPDELLGVDPTDLYANGNVDAEIVEIEEKHPESSGVEVEFQRKDGSTFVGLLNRTKILDEEGTVQYYDAVVTDISDQREREEARRKRRQKVEALYTATGRLLRAQDREEVADQIHRMVDDEFGCGHSDIRFVEKQMLVSTNSSFERQQDPLRSDLEIEGNSLPAKAYRQGETVAVSDLEGTQTTNDYDALRALACVPMGSHGVVIVGSCEEGGIPSFDLRLLEILATHAAAVLDRIARERTLRTAKEEAEEANRLKSAMLANMSHEIRTPLTAINGFAELLEEEVEGSHADLARRIRRSGERLLETLTSLVQLSRLEAGVAEVDREPVRLDRAVEETVARLRPEANENSLSVEVHRSDPAIEGLWDEAALKRILTNLLENAIKFTPEGGHVRVELAEKGEEAVLLVEDDGIGMSASFQEVAFDAFQQESEGIDRTHEGAGLGLTVVHRLVRALGGTIELESEPERGTRVAVRLPHARTAGTRHSSVVSREDRPHPRGGQL